MPLPKDWIREFKGIRSIESKIDWLNQQREVLSAYFVNVDGLIEEWERRIPPPLSLSVWKRRV